MPPSVPFVEVANNADALSVRCPHRETDAGDPVDYHRMCAQLFIEAQVSALGDQVHVDLAQDRGKPVGVVDGAAFPARLPFAFIELGSC